MFANTQYTITTPTYGVVRIGTIDELSGFGEEWLVDKLTRSCVLAKFLNGDMITIDMGCPTLEESQAPTKVAA